MTVRLWRCRECGKWSHAQRDPIRHERWTNITVDGEIVSRSAVWCGPFDRLLAEIDPDHTPRPPLANIGELTGRSYAIFDDPDAGSVF